MKKTYRVTSVVRFVNRLTARFIDRGMGPPQRYMLGVRGRKSGKLYSAPVTVVEELGQRWLVAAYGEVAWVINARAAGEVTLSRGGQSQTLAIRELPVGDRAPILKKYVALEPLVLPYFEARKDSPLEVFAAEAQAHPVFLLESKVSNPRRVA